MARLVRQGSSRKKRGKSPLNRSLKRGVAILRAFRPGSELLGNGDLAERTGLARASVSRLTRTLVETGYLEYDARQRAYRLGAPVLSLGHAMRTGSSVLRVATPLMATLARRLRINVGLAVRDCDEMVYLESIRFNAKASQRRVVSGHRVPIELTSLGRAYLAVAPEADRAALMAQLKARRLRRWAGIEQDIAEAAASVARKGYCVATWQPQVVALAAPIVSARGPIYVLNVSVTSEAAVSTLVRQLEPPLLLLLSRLRQAIAGLDA
ncbi:MAG: helix-turn-helix domain-containing protein [Rhodopseudomonas sp.]|nr:helix-turn-helix domain-containing protein [Rhodopseudomonas sp.]